MYLCANPVCYNVLPNAAILKGTLSEGHMCQFLKPKLEKFSQNFSSLVAVVTVENK